MCHTLFCVVRTTCTGRIPSTGVGIPTYVLLSSDGGRIFCFRSPKSATLLGSSRGPTNSHHLPKQDVLHPLLHSDRSFRYVPRASSPSDNRQERPLLLFFIPCPLLVSPLFSVASGMAFHSRSSTSGPRATTGKCTKEFFKSYPFCGRSMWRLVFGCCGRYCPIGRKRAVGGTWARALSTCQFLTF